MVIMRVMATVIVLLISNHTPIKHSGYPYVKFRVASRHLLCSQYVLLSYCISANPVIVFVELHNIEHRPDPA